tara:strand:- start:398 stop:1453 length:1056 start_codon:yes stop_codon:yes gene_type:complete
MSQKVKCPRCKNVFSLEDAHEHEIKNIKEKVKKEALAEAQAEKVKADKELNIRERALKAKEEKIKKEAKKEALAEAQAEKVKADKESRKEKEALQEELRKKDIAHQKDVARMRKKAEQAAMAASQSPVERKGEVQEERIGEFLKKEFPFDKYEDVEKGKKGADVIQFVQSKNQTIGKILHESKDVLKFDEKWVGKLLNDMAREDATIGVIFTKAMPNKSNGLVEEREGGRIVICSEYPIFRQIISIHRKLIQQLYKNKLNNSDASSKLENLYNYINSNEFKLQYRKTMKGINKEGSQIDKDERSNEIQIKNRKQNFTENKKNINSIITSIISNSNLSEDLLDIDGPDNLLE